MITRRSIITAEENIEGVHAMILDNLLVESFQDCTGLHKLYARCITKQLTGERKDNRGTLPRTVELLMDRDVDPPL
jgi:hypothetical protein